MSSNVLFSVGGGIAAFAMAFVVTSGVLGGGGPVEDVAPATPEERHQALASVTGKMLETANGMRGEKVASNVVVDKATLSANGRVVTYHYRITNVSAAQYDRARAARLKTKLQKKACRDRGNRRAMDLGGEIRYAYKGSGGVQFYTVPVNSGICARLA